MNLKSKHALCEIEKFKTHCLDHCFKGRNEIKQREFKIEQKLTV